MFLLWKFFEILKIKWAIFFKHDFDTNFQKIARDLNFLFTDILTGLESEHQEIKIEFLVLSYFI